MSYPSDVLTPRPYEGARDFPSEGAAEYRALVERLYALGFTDRSNPSGHYINVSRALNELEARRAGA